MWVEGNTVCLGPRDGYALAVASFAKGDWRRALAWSEAVLAWCGDGADEHKFGAVKLAVAAGIRDQSREKLNEGSRVQV